MTKQTQLQRLADLVTTDQQSELRAQHLDCLSNLDNAVAAIKPGRKYTKIDVGSSGKYMVENSTGRIYGIKSYGVINRHHSFGTLDTIDEWFWGRYTASKNKAVAA
jgi:hypothetical protein